MNISGLFIRRPVATTLLMLGVLIFGTIAFRLMPVSDLPNVDYPFISVSASLPGASAETMASSVATPLEKVFSTIAGIESMTSASSQGRTSITLQFALDRDIDAAAQDVQSAISQSLGRLPSNMPNPPTLRKVNPADSPILFIAVTSPTLPMWEIDQAAQTMMAQRISMVSGVAQVSVYGSQKYAVRIQLDPQGLAAKGIGVNEVASAIQSANVNLPTGALYGQQEAYTIESAGQLEAASEYNDIIVAYRNGRPVRLKDVGQAVDGVENDKVAAWYCTPDSQQRAIVLAVQRQPGTNTVEVAKAVRELLPTLQQTVPAAITLHLLNDQSVWIEESVRDVEFTLLLTLGLVVMVIFVFLRNLWATVIPSMALPMSLVGTFCVMWVLGYSLDNLSLMALTLSVGFVVDDAIVMLENIVRHMEMGKTRLQAALDGSREIGFTIVSMTLSLAAVFIPVLFMGGLVGRLFREFSVTIGAAVLISGIVSLTLTPMLASRFLRPSAQAHHGRIFALTEWGYQAMVRFYGWTLRGVLRTWPVTIALSVAILAAMVWLFGLVPKGFLPSEDRAMLTIRTEGAQGTSFDAMVRRQNALVQILRQDPNVDAFMSSAGGRGGEGGNTGFMFVRLKPREQRSMSADEVAQALRPRLNSIPGIVAYPSVPLPINIGGRQARALYQYTLQSVDTDLLYGSAARLEDKLRALPELLDVSSDLQIQNPQVSVAINRDQAAVTGVTAAQVQTALGLSYGSREVSTILGASDDYPVIMELLPAYQRDPSALSLLYLRSPTGLVPLEAVTKRDINVGPLQVNHQGQLPAVTVSFNLAPGVSLGQATQAVRDTAHATLPGEVSASFAGTAQAFESSTSDLLWLLLAAVIVIYLVLGILYESFIHPLTILTALPFAGFGALATLLMFNVDLSLYAFVGIIMLIGLVKKNGIIMIDFALSSQREGKTAREAIYEACVIRFRPIMMTTFAALMAAIPIAMGHGAGGEARRPLGLAVVGGLVFSQTLTLYATPVFFMFFEWLRRRGRKESAPQRVPVQPPDMV
jgi:HAE1 family hydrophobic/amphiphilic exporter-1